MSSGMSSGATRHCHVEAAIGQRDIPGVAVDERKGGAEFLLESGVVHRALTPGTFKERGWRPGRLYGEGSRGPRPWDRPARIGRVVSVHATGALG